MFAVQGGPGFPFFSGEVYKYFTAGELTNLKLASCEVPDPEIREFVTKVMYMK